MEYYKLLNLSQEPFSNTPDPGLFFRSTSHARCLQELEIAIRLRRGLVVVAGEVGTGKTTICRHLIRTMAGDEALEIYMILDPSFEDAGEMLRVLNAMFSGEERAAKCATAIGHKEMIKDYLFTKGVNEHKTLILVVDEGQKLSSAGVEILRELLNYETNDQKLLQILIFAQNEIDQTLAKHQNFADRVGLYHKLLPLDRKDTGLFIEYRLERCGSHDPEKERVRFTRGAIRLIHAMTGGHPRRIINLCHNILLTLIIKGSFKVTPAVVRKAAQNLPTLRRVAGFGWPAWAMTATALLLVLGWLGHGPSWRNGAQHLRARLHQVTLEIKSAVGIGSDGGNTQSPPEALAAAANVQPAGPLAPANADARQREESTATEKTAQGRGAAVPVELAALVPPPATSHLPEPAPEKPAETRFLDPGQVPSRLGYARVNQNEALWNMIQKIYGFCTTEMIDQVARYNPGIANVNLIYRGQRIEFPVAEARPALNSEKYWIEVGRFADLDKAYQRIYSGSSALLRVLSVWNPEKGFQYLVTAKTPFANIAAAKQGLAILPPEVATGSKVTEINGQLIIGGVLGEEVSANRK